MHGGGGAPSEVNDQQWQNQVKLYDAPPGVGGLYVAPRAPTDTWNLWHEAHIDALFSRLIEDYVALRGQHDFEITPAGETLFNAKFGQPSNAADIVIALPDRSREVFR